MELKKYPLKLSSVCKEIIWGGTKLKSDFGKVCDLEKVAESWELTVRYDGMNVIENGECAGMPLADYLGDSSKGFPLLIKLIDACDKLSIQVHPSDETAEAGEQGKAEMWYIVDCEPQAFLYYGFSHKIDADELLRRAQDGTICDVLNKVPVAKGDVFYILPGTIHAIGAGIVIAEIQQNSNTTFRVYDYQRRGTDGKLRPLHLERAAAVMDYEPVIPEECKANSVMVFPEFTMAEMFSCQYFRAWRIDVYTSARLACDGHSFQHLQCVDGQGVIRCNGAEYPFVRGESFLMPAALGEYSIEGECRVLLSRV